jgi:hypothetical protein
MGPQIKHSYEDQDVKFLDVKGLKENFFSWYARIPVLWLGYEPSKWRFRYCGNHSDWILSRYCQEDDEILPSAYKMCVLTHLVNELLHSFVSELPLCYYWEQLLVLETKKELCLSRHRNRRVGICKSQELIGHLEAQAKDNYRVPRHAGGSGQYRWMRLSKTAFAWAMTPCLVYSGRCWGGGITN